MEFQYIVKIDFTPTTPLLQPNITAGKRAIAETMNCLIGLHESYDGVKGPLTSDQISSIFGFHPSIHFVMLAKEDGTLLDSVKRAGSDTLEPPQEIRKALERCANAAGWLAGSDVFLGRMRMIIVRREKHVELLYPSAGFMIVIIAHPAFPLDKAPQLEGVLNKLKVEGDEWRRA